MVITNRDDWIEPPSPVVVYLWISVAVGGRLRGGVCCCCLTLGEWIS